MQKIHIRRNDVMRRLLAAVRSVERLINDDDDDDDSTWLVSRRNGRRDTRRERSPVSFHGLEKSHFTRP